MLYRVREKTRSRFFPTPICYIGSGKKQDLAFSLPLIITNSNFCTTLFQELCLIKIVFLLPVYSYQLLFTAVLHLTLCKYIPIGVTKRRAANQYECMLCPDKVNLNNLSAELNCSNRSAFISFHFTQFDTAESYKYVLSGILLPDITSSSNQLLRNTGNITSGFT